MKERSISITIFIIIMALLTYILPLTIIYFTSSNMIMLLLSSFMLLVGCHIILEKSFSYEACFLFIIITFVLSFITTLVTYFFPNKLLNFSNTCLLLLGLDLILPLLYCILRNLLDRGPRFVNFNSFFTKINIVSLIFYLLILFYIVFYQNLNISNTMEESFHLNFIPCLTLATYIESFIENNTSFQPLIIDIASIVSLFIPLGFFIRVALRKATFLLRNILMVLSIILIEIAQFYFMNGIFDVDDIFLMLVGCLIGATLYNIINQIYLSVTDNEFLYDRSPHFYYRRQRF